MLNTIPPVITPYPKKFIQFFIFAYIVIMLEKKHAMPVHMIPRKIGDKNVIKGTDY